MKMKLPINVDLSGKVVVITGAGGVLCGQMAEVIALCGAKVALLNRSVDKAQVYAERIISRGGSAKVYKCNVLDKANCMEVAEAVKKDFGTCDILINGAGGNHQAATTDKEYFNIEDLDGDTKTFFDLDGDGVKQVFNLNFIGTLIPSQVFAAQMLGKEGCSVVNISSMNAYKPLTKIPAYSGAKAATSNLTQWMAVHFSKVGIRCNGIAPGFFVSAQNEKLLFNEDGTATERTKKILNSTPLERFGKSEELNGALLFLLNEEAASFITGIVIPIDGGFLAYSGV